MLTCVDCLHIEVCAYIKHDLPICSDFADRSKYVVREKGEWVKITGMAPPEYHGKHMCSLCYARALERKYHEELSDFCPNCGADMRTEEQNRAREVENDG